MTSILKSTKAKHARKAAAADTARQAEPHLPPQPAKPGIGSRLAKLAKRPQPAAAGAGTPPDQPLTPPGAVESAPQPRAAQHPGSRFARLLPKLRPLGVGIFVLGVLFFVAQARLLGDQRDAATSLHRAARKATVILAKPLAAARQRVGAAMTDPRLLAILANSDAGIQTAARTQAVQRVQTLLPRARDIAVFGPAIEALTDANLAQLGYVRAAQLARAQSSGAAQVSVVEAGDQQHHLSVVEPILGDGRILAYAAVNLTFAPIAKAFAGLTLPRGRVDLRLGGGNNAPVLLSRGAGAAAIDQAYAIPGSGLWLTTAFPASAASLPTIVSPTLAWVLAMLCLLGAVMIAAGEQRLRALPRWLRREGNRANEPTLAQMLNAPRAKPATEAATQVASEAAPDATADVTPAAGVAVERSIFRAYDIRGVLGKTLDAGVARLIGRAIGSVAREQGVTEIVVGRDGRLSGPELVEALGDGLRASGVDVIDIGAMPTPVVYFACYQLNTGSGVAVTGSHNPPDYNGFKIVIDGVTLAEDAIQGLYERIAEGRFSEGHGELRQLDVSADYVERIASDVQTERTLKVVVDCGNGIAGAIGPEVLTAIGAQVIPLYAEVDGTFPNHHPDPSDPRNLKDLILAVKHQDADLGIAFDGDGDRLGVVTKNGEIIYPDRLLMLFAIDVLARDPGATIIYDVKCSGQLQPVILRHGGSPLMWRTGHSLIKAKMRETDAALAGEMSGHFFFAERWYGFDDGIYAAARLLEILAADAHGRPPEQTLAALPNGVSTPELHIAMDDGARFVARFRDQARFEDARITTIDGVRADWPDGWGLVRASNTTPVLVLRFDADNDAALTRIKEAFRSQLLALNANLELPF